jgi:GNAT superfamily N-acetyltransferase
MDIWANAVMNAALAVIAAVGIWAGSPFVKPFAIEAGLPQFLADEPFMTAILNDLTWPWVGYFAAMTAVCCVAPLYQCFFADLEKPQNSTYDNLNIAFTYVCQYSILAFAITFGTSPPGAGTAEWLQCTPAEYAAEYGVPLPEGRQVAVRDGKSIVRALCDDRVNEDEDTESRATSVLAKAFVEDPLFKTWRGFGEIADLQEREQALKPMFRMFVRIARRFNHCFEVNNGSAYCICLPCWNGDEKDRALSNEAGDIFREPGVASLLSPALAMPPVELYHLGKKMKKALKGRPYLYVMNLGTEPSQQGNGYGRAALFAGLQVADERGVPTALETMTRTNRAMYEKYGFVVVGEVQVPGCVDPWVVMLREPKERSANLV